MFLSTASGETLHTSILRKISEITCLPCLKFLNASNLPLLSTTYLLYYELSTIKYKDVLFPSIFFSLDPHWVFVSHSFCGHSVGQGIWYTIFICIFMSYVHIFIYTIYFNVA